MTEEQVAERVAAKLTDGFFIDQRVSHIHTGNIGIIHSFYTDEKGVPSATCAWDSGKRLGAYLRNLRAIEPAL
jgi:hypothetical protein